MLRTPFTHPLNLPLPIFSLTIFRLPQSMLYLLPEQAFRRLPRAGASPCTPA
ncbi:hypothetical protein GCWU000324_00261 [Kingella oralis ATCC 51147]|uniref:Uncharacterized protein n=1 Tax=Kingella oralis ATCC 51147 TaxID=629741 RepID=C4GHC9_9NEIS|nr:hypothetical protein GCWU000324_00261 [Kingella oralis ATCC 51147]